MAKMGRPRKEIDKDTFEKLCGLFCTEEEIAAVFKCDVRTIERWCQRTYKKTFVDVYKKYTENGRASLRRLQFLAAQKGSVPMLIFLGKNYLGQSDVGLKIDNKADGKLAELIDGLKEENDIHEETESLDALMADKQAEEN